MEVKGCSRGNITSGLGLVALAIFLLLGLYAKGIGDGAHQAVFSHYGYTRGNYTRAETDTAIAGDAQGITGTRTAVSGPAETWRYRDQSLSMLPLDNNNYTRNTHLGHWKDIIYPEAPPFIKDLKNPCWWEPLNENHTDFNGFFYKDAGWAHRRLERRKAWANHMAEGYTERLRCLPYFFIAGFAKCGTTDLFDKLVFHPSILPGLKKENHWWTRRRYSANCTGRPSLASCDPRHGYSFRHYVDLFDPAAEIIQQDLRNASHRGLNPTQLITGEGTASTLWDNDKWRLLPENQDTAGPLEEPRYLIAHNIHRLLPDAKIIVIVRNPTDRLYSDYMYVTGKSPSKSQEVFHREATKMIKLLRACIARYSNRSCAYSASLANKVAKARVRIGMYSVYLQDWLTVYPRKQIHVVRTESYSADPITELNKIYKFLELEPLPAVTAKFISDIPRANERRKQDSRLGGMWAKTRQLIDDFYRPYNQQLAAILEDDQFLWTDT